MTSIDNILSEETFDAKAFATILRNGLNKLVDKTIPSVTTEGNKGKKVKRISIEN